MGAPNGPGASDIRHLAAETCLVCVSWVFCPVFVLLLLHMRNSEQCRRPWRSGPVFWGQLSETFAHLGKAGRCDGQAMRVY